ncbi:hypothetical protein JOD64_003790 [Micromonospora luteifusca]|uniref:Uncharacterized protein n=1 Tax=Micromonospora luteifusca TaxID=709860 RepID=A0ABS2LWK6_9ACTN|nr:hypothetical protein [Micromonospora luteifusca]MBM7492568.1 hypothetical protein [Micromonospora luteifusca]
MENPSDLHDAFALVAPDHPDPPRTATVLVKAGADRVHSFRDASGRRPVTDEWGTDPRDIAVAGATSGVLRSPTAATAGAPALLGATLGTIGAYLGLIGAYWGRLATLGHVPVVHLLVLVLGLPLIAAACGWLLAGREPPTVARRALT